MELDACESQSNVQLDGGLEYLRSLGDAEFDTENFEKAAGVGIAVIASFSLKLMKSSRSVSDLRGGYPGSCQECYCKRNRASAC